MSCRTSSTRLFRAASAFALTALVSTGYSAAPLFTVYEDNFDGDGYGTNAGTGGGLEYAGGLYADWVETAAGITFGSGGNGGTHSNIATINGFDLTGGFKLTVTYNATFNSGTSTRFVMGLMDTDTVQPYTTAGGGSLITATGTAPKASALLSNGEAAYGYGIGFAPYTTNQLNGLTFNNTTTVTEIDQTQSRTTGAHTLVLEMDGASNWSYSIDGATPTTGTIGGGGFDYTRDFSFVTKSQKMAVTISAVKLESATNVPEPGSLALLGLGGLLIARRRR